MEEKTHIGEKTKNGEQNKNIQEKKTEKENKKKPKQVIKLTEKHGREWPTTKKRII